ncbi:MAG: DEAD/DEAH box helicase, partial [Pseudomonadota bacterium]
MPAPLPSILPTRFTDWFSSRGWQARPHQLALTEAALNQESALLIAPTGGGKTLAGFLASLIELSTAKPNRPRL